MIVATYNHAFTLGFAVGGSKHEKWEDALNDPTEKPMIIGALLRRIREFDTNNAEYIEALEGFDTYQEDFTGFDEEDDTQ